MWHAYQYGQGRLKLVKDLKTGQAQLRVSLIDKEQINDLTKIYKDRKNYYRIDEQSMIAPPVAQEEEEQEGTAHLGYKEKVELYRRRLQSEKLEDKYSNLFKKTEKRRFQMRKPVLFKLLQSFEETHKHEDHLKVAEDTKESDKNLEMIKINTNRRVNFHQQHIEDLTVERPKFLSLQNGLPQKERVALPKWPDYAEGRYIRPDRSNQGINLTSLQANIDLFMGLNPTRSKKHSQSAVNHTHSLHRQLSTPFHRQKPSPSARNTLHHENSFAPHPEQRKEHQSEQPCDFCKRWKEKYGEQHRPEQIMINRTFKSKSAVTNKRMNKNKTVDNITNNASKTFARSETCSKDVIETMSGFYDSKASKKSEYKKMILFLKNDRPLTSEIRRRNYKMIGESQLKGVKQYRNFSEQERLKLRDGNHQFYMGLLRKMEKHGVEQLPLSAKIIERIRLILESNYIVTRQHFQIISQPTLYQQRDALSQTLISQIQALVSRHSSE